MFLYRIKVWEGRQRDPNDESLWQKVPGSSVIFDAMVLAQDESIAGASFAKWAESNSIDPYEVWLEVSDA